MIFKCSSLNWININIQFRIIAYLYYENDWCIKNQIDLALRQNHIEFNHIVAFLLFECPTFNCLIIVATEINMCWLSMCVFLDIVHNHNNFTLLIDFKLRLIF